LDALSDGITAANSVFVSHNTKDLSSAHAFGMTIVAFNHDDDA
jgi:hypothetical protein